LKRAISSILEHFLQQKIKHFRALKTVNSSIGCFVDFITPHHFKATH